MAIVHSTNSRGAWDVKNYTGYVNFFRNFQLTPHPAKNHQIGPKKGTISPKMEFLLPHAVGFTD
jgi:hypothetical protein